ncbi:hypothetical protein D0T50_01850 [Bacteroides sp. 214]|uniref:NVEALA domain-containing protein n=1 Tax=Bacteroides sp. 214 TaxID=2302935 RepID=UPI0013D32A64|nr:NVEALA domain-containing protein [Bacteroides sp. 214]NDW11630.1 hypothetical protein [Bacteroides sp. 214]
MKKIKLYFVGIVILVIAISCFSLNKQNKSNKVLLSNVEALANGENDGFCAGTGSVDCPRGNIKVYKVYLYR